MQMATNKSPFSYICLNPFGAVNYLSKLASTDVVPLPEGLHPHVASFLEKTLSVTPSARPSCEILLHHPLLVGTL